LAAVDLAQEPPEYRALARSWLKQPRAAIERR
jgi:hypothetical protein